MGFFVNNNKTKFIVIAFFCMGPKAMKDFLEDKSNVKFLLEIIKRYSGRTSD